MSVVVKLESPVVSSLFFTSVSWNKRGSSELVSRVDESFRAMLNMVQPSLVKLVLEIRAGSWTASCNMPPTHTLPHHFSSPHTLLIQTHMSTLSWAFLALIIQTHGSPNLLCLEGVSPSSFLVTRKLMEQIFVKWTTSLSPYELFFFFPLCVVN